MKNLDSFNAEVHTGRVGFDAEAPLPPEVLNISNKVRSNLFTWRGQFSPQLVEALIKTYGYKSEFVMDPFTGSGTVLYEAGRMGKMALGVEVNPAAAILARIYQMINVTMEQRRGYLSRLDQLLDFTLPESSNLFTSGVLVSSSSLQNSLVSALTGLEPGPCRDLWSALIITLDFIQDDLDPRRLFQQWKELKRIVNFLPHSTQPIEVALGDARKLPVATGAIDLVITSPPYINVFNYHQQYRKSAEAIGYHPLEAARSEIGSNRKHRQNRLLTVIQYCLDMAQVLAELRRASAPQGLLILVVGRESNVKKTPFYNAKIIETLAAGCAQFTLILKQERVFKNKFGQMIFEDILHFRPEQARSVSELSVSRKVAEQTLEEAMARAHPSTLADFREALKSIEKVEPSPFVQDLPAGPVAIDLGKD